MNRIRRSEQDFADRVASRLAGIPGVIAVTLDVTVDSLLKKGRTAIRASAAVGIILLLFAIGDRAGAQQLDEYLIGNGQFGSWHIGGSADYLLQAWSKMFGKPSDVRETKAIDQVVHYFCWRQSGHCVAIAANKVLAIVAWDISWRTDTPFSVLNTRYHTIKGVHIGSIADDVLTAYGPPDRQWDQYDHPEWSPYPVAAFSVLIWREDGLYVQVNPINHVIAIGISDFALPWEECLGDILRPFNPTQC